jgi:hypothetical protein
LTTGKKYIGNTQQHVKTRIQQHVRDVKNLVSENKKSDSFAQHFARLIPEKTEREKMQEFIKLKVDILWSGNAMSCVKTFGTKSCKLCSKERMAILNLSRKHPDVAINKCSEVYGACRHIPRFHRFEKVQVTSTSTDESNKDERVYSRPSSTTSVESERSSDTAKSFFDKRESELLSPPFNLTNSVCRIQGLLARIDLNPNLSDEPQVEHNLHKLPPQGYLSDLPLTEAVEDYI